MGEGHKPEIFYFSLASKMGGGQVGIRDGVMDATTVSIAIRVPRDRNAGPMSRPALTLKSVKNWAKKAVLETSVAGHPTPGARVLNRFQLCRIRQLSCCNQSRIDVS